MTGVKHQLEEDVMDRQRFTGPESHRQHFIRAKHTPRLQGVRNFAAPARGLLNLELTQIKGRDHRRVNNDEPTLSTDVS